MPQDTLLVLLENYGDIIYIERFRINHQLNLFVCRKSDSENKGIVESGAIRYI